MVKPCEKHGKSMWNAKAVGTYSTRRNTTWNDKTKIQCKMLKSYRALEIYISGQVDTLNKSFKLSYTSKVKLFILTRL